MVQRLLEIGRLGTLLAVNLGTSLTGIIIKEMLVMLTSTGKGI